ncbi:hypothetical protein [Fluviicola sp.]|uniref:hypothetical protein n=1 Tax=Fluviicola sp. TaxID=1917219 RepID=UPI003D2BC634
MSKVKLNLLFLCLFFVYTQGMWERTLFFLPDATYIVDVAIVAFIVFQFKWNPRTPGSKVFFAFLLTAFLVGITNSDSISETFLYTRFTIYTYLIYVQVYNLGLDTKTWFRLLKFSVWMIIIQVLGSLYTIFFLGEQIEGYVGLMSSSGGTTATIFPLFVSSIAFLYYLFRSQMLWKEWLILLLVFLSAFLVGYASGKRGIYFTLPVFFIIVLIMAFPILIKSGFFKRKLIGIVSITIVLIPVLIFGIFNSRGLNYSLSGNESYSEVVSNSFSFAEEYESATDEYGRTIGRSNTTTQIIDKSLSDPTLFISGVGYGTTKEESTMLRLGYGYGLVGFTRDLISAGWIFSVLAVIFMSLIISRNHSVKLGLTKILRRLILLIFLYTHFFYSSDFTVSLKINLLMVILLALINSPLHKNASLEVFTSNRLIK